MGLWKTPLSLEHLMTTTTSCFIGWWLLSPILTCNSLSQWVHRLQEVLQAESQHLHCLMPLLVFLFCYSLPLLPHQFKSQYTSNSVIDCCIHDYKIQIFQGFRFLLCSTSVAKGLFFSFLIELKISFGTNSTATNNNMNAFMYFLLVWNNNVWNVFLLLLLYCLKFLTLNCYIFFVFYTII